MSAKGQQILRWAVQDWRTSRVRMRSITSADPWLRVVYFELLNAQAEEGGTLPADPEVLADSLGCPAAEVKRCLPILAAIGKAPGSRGGLIIENGSVSNKRVSDYIEEELSYRTQQQEFGRQGGRIGGKGRPRGTPKEPEASPDSDRDSPNPPLPCANTLASDQTPDPSRRADDREVLPRVTPARPHEIVAVEPQEKPRSDERSALQRTRDEIRALLADVVAEDPRGRDGQAALAAASRVGAKVITNVEGCSSLPWLTTTREKLLGNLLAIRAERDERTVPARPSEAARARMEGANALLSGSLRPDEKRALAGRAEAAGSGVAVAGSIAGAPGGARPGLPGPAGSPERGAVGARGKSGSGRGAMVPADSGAAAVRGGNPGAAVVGGAGGDERGRVGAERGVSGATGAAAPERPDPDPGGASGRNGAHGGGNGRAAEGARDPAGDDPGVQGNGNGVAGAAWASVREQLRARLPAEAFEAVFAPARALDLVDEGPGRTLLLEAPARTVLYAQSVHGEELAEAIESAGLDNVVVEFRIAE